MRTRFLLAATMALSVSAACAHPFQATRATSIIMPARQLPGDVSVRVEVSGVDPLCSPDHTATYRKICLTGIQPVAQLGLEALMDTFFEGTVGPSGASRAVLRIVELDQHEDGRNLVLDVAYQFELLGPNGEVILRQGRRLSGSRTVRFDDSDADMVITTILDDIGNGLNETPVPEAPTSEM